MLEETKIRGKRTMMNILKENSSRRRKGKSQEIISEEVHKFVALEKAIEKYFEV